MHHSAAATLGAAPHPVFRASAAAPLRADEPPIWCWRQSLNLVERRVAFKRHSLQAGDPVQTAGDAFDRLHLVHFGVVKTMVLASYGCQQVTGLDLKGD